MIYRWINRLGVTKTILLITVSAVLSSVLLYLLSSVFLGKSDLRGIISSAIIPMVVAPILSLFFLKVTARLYLSEKALQQSEEKHKTVLDNIEDGYYEVDIAGNFTFFNDSMCSILGYSAQEMMGVNNREFMDKENTGKVFQIFNQVFSTGVSSKGFGWEVIKPDGDKRYLDTSVSLIRDTDGHVTGFRGIARDMTNRKLVEEELKESREKYRQLFNHAPAGIYEIDFIKGKLVSVNDVICEYTGYTRDELLSMSAFDLLTKESQEKFIDRLDRLFKGETIPDVVENKVRTKDGREIWVLFNTRFVYDEDGHPTGATVVAHRIDERKKAEEEKKRLEGQLRQAQKMEAIGTLAGGIAHDFNNILSAIMGYTEISMLKVPEDIKLHQYLKKIMKASMRAREMVKQILAFSRKSDYECKPIQVDRIIQEALKILKSSFPSFIEIQTSIDPDVGIIDADTVQIQRVVMNLCTNAAHAMKNNGGILGVRLINIELNEEDVSIYPDIQPGSFLKLSVSDTGDGLSDDVMDRMFDPYYTTKEKGAGTGLGLSIVHGIVKAHNGFITVESVMGKGSVFNVFFPRADGDIELQEKEPEDIPTGFERILFIDDEQALVDVGKQMLKHLGYQVTTRTNSVEALSLFQSDPFLFDLVITDMTMPELTGDKLSEKLMKIRPNIPIILCTGHSDDITEDDAKKLGIKAFVMKPYLISDLAKMVRQVIDMNTS